MIGSTETSVNIIESTEARIPTRAADLERYRLRRFVAELPSDEIEIRREPIDLAGVAEALEGNPRAVMFAAVGPERQQLVGNVTGSRARIARAFDVAPGELVAELQRRLRNRPEVVEVSRAEAPAQEVVLTGEDADLTALPVHLQHGADGAPYISSSIPRPAGPISAFAASCCGDARKPESISTRPATCAPSTRRAPPPGSRCRSASWSDRTRSITSPQ